MSLRNSKILAPQFIKPKSNNVVSATLFDFFTRYAPESKRLKPVEAQLISDEIAELKKPDQNYLLSSDDNFLTYEICGGFVKSESVEIFVACVKNIALNSDDIKQALFDSQWFSEEKKNYDEHIRMINKKIVTTKGIFKCPKCKSSNTETIGIQVSSGDEPQKNFNTCNNCTNRWRSD